MSKLILSACLGLFAEIAWAQGLTFIEIETDNGVFYSYDTADFSKFATSPGVVAPFSASPLGFPANYWTGVFIADIVSVNGRPARGVMVRRGTRVSLTQTPSPGQAIADVSRSFIDDGVWEIQQPDGTPVGTVTTHGFIGGPPPAGAPGASTNTNLAVTGGTGAFLGSRGQMTSAPVTGSAGARTTSSITEDPANRRANGGNRSRFLLQLIPVSRPEIVATAAGLAIVHAADGKPVSSANPANRGEALTLYVKGLGPTRPALEPGGTFPSAPVSLVTSPVEITINGSQAQVLYAGGYPGSGDAYQVNFKVPENIAPGAATLQLSLAWIASDRVPVAIN